MTEKQNFEQRAGDLGAQLDEWSSELETLRDRMRVKGALAAKDAKLWREQMETKRVELGRRMDNAKQRAGEGAGEVTDSLSQAWKRSLSAFKDVIGELDNRGS